MRYRFSTIYAALGLAIPVVGCSGAPTSTGPQSGALDAVVHETVVKINSDGTATVRQVVVSAEAFQAQLSLRQGRIAATSRQGNQVAEPQKASPVNTGENLGVTSQAITDDTSCSNGDDLWLADFEGGCSGNLLCLNGAGTLDLSTIAYPNGGDWSTKVAGYSPGTESGAILNPDFSVEDSWTAADTFSCHGCTGGWPRYAVLYN